MTVIAAGNPALTHGMVTRITDFFEWVLEAPLTSEQRAKIRAGLVEAWKKSNKDDIAGSVEILQADDQVAKLSEAERTLVLRQLQPELLKTLKASPGDEYSRWLLAIYESAHAPLAAGKPPLTRQISDAQAELLAFMLGEAVGEAIPADRQFKDDWARWLQEAYPKLPADRQAEYAQSPVVWASLQIVWAKANEGERAKLRKEWATILQGALPLAKERAALERGLRDLATLAELRSKRELTPPELERGAASMEAIARAVRQTGAEGAAGQADEIAKSAGELRRYASSQREASARPAAVPPAQPTPAGTSLKDPARNFAALQNQQAAFRSMMNFQMQMHYSRVNTINTLGGNPYRYVNGYGHPY